ncbi:hypothetical protein MMM127_14950 [Helicobacter pylori]
MYIDMFSPKPFALLVGNDNEEKILKLPLLAKKQEDNISIYSFHAQNTHP